MTQPSQHSRRSWRSWSSRSSRRTGAGIGIGIAAAIAIGVAAAAIATAIVITTRDRSRSADASSAASCSSQPLPVVRIAHANPLKDSPGRRMLPASQFADTRLLQRFGREGAIRPGLASQWETSDRRTWRFTLRTGLRTQRGEPLTAAMIADALRVSLPQRGYDPVARDLVRIETPTPTTLVFELARPSSAFLEAIGISRIAEPAQKPELYAGPFRLTRESDTEMVYEAFPDTWSGRPTVAGVHVQFFPTPRAAWAALLRDEADFLTDVPVDAAPLLAQNPEIRLIPNDYDYVFSLAFRVTHPLLRDVRVRRALNLAIDRQAIVDRFFAQYSSPARGPLAPDVNADDADREHREDREEPWPYDPPTARALLKEALGGRTQPIALTCLTSNQLPTVAGIAAMVAAQLEQVNVHLRLEGVTIDEFNARTAKGEFEVIAAPMATGASVYWSYVFWHTNPHPVLTSGYTAADDAYDALYTAATPDAERIAAAALRDVMRRDPPGAFIAPIPNLRAVRRNWRVPEDDANMIRSLPRWTRVDMPLPCGSEGGP